MIINEILTGEVSGYLVANFCMSPNTIVKHFNIFKDDTFSILKEEASEQFISWYGRCLSDGIDPLSIITSLPGKEFALFDSRIHPVVFADQSQFDNAVKNGVLETNNFFSKSCDSLLDLINESVQGNTFRAFHLRARGGRPPSVVYREYTTQLIKNRFDDFRSIKNWEEYTEFVEKSAKGLVAKFDSEAKELGFLGFGSAAKLLNLSFKHVLKYRGFEENERIRLISFLHVPLDSFTLQGIRKLALDFKIPSNASMGWEKLKNVEFYLKIQIWIRKECTRIECLPIHYEVAAWNLSHPKLAIHSHEK